jgi:polar amino acid transport system substrate-binding protein
MPDLARRSVMGGIGAVTLALASGKLSAQGAPGNQGLLARLQAAKKVRVGIANQPPFSALNSDGTLTGVAPGIVQLVMKRLGITAFEVSIGTYGELIPGMLAGRWDFIGAALTITKPRCEQVLYSDPLTLDARAIVSFKGELADPPTLIADFVKKNTIVGVFAGGADLRLLLSVGIPQANLRQFPNDSALMDGLIAKRMQVVFGSYSALKDISQKRGLDLAMTYPIADDVPSFAACAFRKEDTDLYDAFQKELSAMKASGEFRTIVEQYGFEAPALLLNATSAQACAF